MSIVQRVSRLGAVTVVLAVLCLVPAARAGEFAGDVPDLVWVDIGGQTNDITTDVAVSGAAGAGAIINFEDVFDLPGSQTTFRMLGTAHVSPKRRYVDF